MQLAKHVKFREEKFGGPLRDPPGKVFTLNATAAAVVREIAAGHDQKEIAARLADRFSGPPAAIEREVAGLIETCSRRGWRIRRVASSEDLTAPLYVAPGRSRTSAISPACTASRKAGRARRLRTSSIARRCSM